MQISSILTVHAQPYALEWLLEYRVLQPPSMKHCPFGGVVAHVQPALVIPELLE